MVTSHDVARLAGVTQATVSRALRDHPDISLATRARVRAAAAEIGYVPSHLGRSLSTRTTRRIGIVAAELTNPFYPALLAPLHQQLVGAGYSSILITDSGTDGPDLAALFDGSVDGVVLTAIHLDSTLPAELVRHGLPVVLLNRTSSEHTADSCSPDNAAGAAQIAELLIGLGHRRIGVLSGPVTISTARERVDAFTAAAAARGVSIAGPAIRVGEYSPESGARELAALLDSANAPTAVFCANDVIALGALNEAKRRGVAVPDQLTVVGFDDIPLASWAVLDLTTAHVDLAEMARHAVRLLLRRISDRTAAAEQVVVPVTLALRGTHQRLPDVGHGG